MVARSLLLGGYCLALLLITVAPVASSAPRLVVQITVDALRGDLVRRFDSVIGQGGFRYLMEQGIDYTNVHYPHANTETIVGHTSLATGTAPAIHGMVANVWFDHELKRLIYNIEDSRYHLLAADADVDRDTEIDPTQTTAKVDGRSPARILSSTFSDELAVHFGGRSKIFAVSVKDRAAVSMAGQAGKAFWFSKASGEFVTSSYYYEALPPWLTRWNARGPTLAYSGQSWQLLYKPSQYLFGQADQRSYETDLAGFGRVFPHSYGQAGDAYFTTFLTLSPAGDRITLDFVEQLLEQERLGQDEVPDYLAVSFSSTDYVGHMFGASSLESEDNLAHLDRTLARLFAYLDEKVGLAHTLIVLSADHGQPEVPGHLHQRGIKTPHYFSAELLEEASTLATLKDRFGLGSELIKAYFHPYLYLDRDLIRRRGLDQAAVEQTLVDALMKLDGITLAVSSRALSTANLADTPLLRTVRANYHPKRSGDIYLVFEPNVFVNDFDGLNVASAHGSPWRYDSFVPLMFAGNGLTPARVHRPVTPYDVAPTLTAVLGIKPPSGAVGEPLREVLVREAGVTVSRRGR